MKKLRNIIIIFSSTILLNCCTTNQTGEVDDEKENSGGESTQLEYSSEYQHNLNVIYFIPSNRSPNPDYHLRLSKILLNGQNFFNSWMKHWGYGDESFGILKNQDKKLIKIINIYGKYPNTYYPYEGGHSNIKKEIDAYFSDNPEERTSEHYLVISAVNTIDPNEVQNSDVPFYGIGGRWAYALDYPGMSIENLGASGTTGFEATKWIGGLLHELGHGLNLPHCGEKVSEKNNPSFGTSLMGGGNYTYGKTPTFLEHSSCAILNNGQLFTKTPKSFYTPNATAKILNINADSDNTNINISGTFQSNIPVTDITFYNRPENNTGGYTAMTWVGKPSNNNTFSIEMPLDEFREKGNLNYEFSIILHHENGMNTWSSYGYKFENDLPIINFGDRDEFDKSNWQIIDFSSEEISGEGSINGKAINLIDGDIETYWHSRWTNNLTNYPHHFTIDTNNSLHASGFSIAQRNGARKIKILKLK